MSIKANSEMNEEKGCVCCSVEVDGRGDIVLNEMCAIVSAFVKANLQQAKPGHEVDVSLLIGKKILSTVVDSSEEFMKLNEKEEWK